MDLDRSEPGPVDGSLLTRQTEHRSTLIWRGEPLRDMRLRVNLNTYWKTVEDRPPVGGVLSAIRASGLYGVYQTGQFRHDLGLITAFVERWRPETHTFHLRVGEATITLEDVHHILGIPTTGTLVIHAFGQPSLPDIRDMVFDILGVYPDGDVVSRGGLRVSWLVYLFADCHRLDDSEDYDRDLVFHIRAHLLLIIGSLFPNSTGSKVQLQFLHFVRDHTQVHTYCWGAAVLAFLYKQLCSASIGDKAEICGAVTLLQVWIWEHFPSLALARLDDVAGVHPLTRRWQVRLRMSAVPKSQVRIARYELDFMTPEHIIWRPYRGVGVDHLPPIATRRLWSAKCPLIFNETVEWCYPDRVTRQFDFRQDIPDSSPDANHGRLHGTINDGYDWVYVHGQCIELWESRHEHMLSPTRYRGGTGCTRGYGPWYDRVTRRFIGNPDVWSFQHGFQGSQGHQPEVSTRRRGGRRHIVSGRPSGRPRDVLVHQELDTYYGDVLTPQSQSDMRGEDTTDGGTSVWGSWAEGTSHRQSQQFDTPINHAGGGEGSWDVFLAVIDDATLLP